MRYLIVREDGSYWPSSLKLLLPHEIRGFAGFSRAVRLDLSLLRIVVPAAAGRNPASRCQFSGAITPAR
jgi:hypothetical protein